MASNDYRFITEWANLGHACRDRSRAGRCRGLARWWPSVYLDVSVIAPGDTTGVGGVVELWTKGWLPSRSVAVHGRRVGSPARVPPCRLGRLRGRGPLDVHGRAAGRRPGRRAHCRDVRTGASLPRRDSSAGCRRSCDRCSARTTAGRWLVGKRACSSSSPAGGQRATPRGRPCRRRVRRPSLITATGCRARGVAALIPIGSRGSNCGCGRRTTGTSRPACSPLLVQANREQAAASWPRAAGAAFFPGPRGVALRPIQRRLRPVPA